MSFVADDLEANCRRLVRALRKQPIDSTPARAVAREIALTLDHLDSVRSRQRDLGRRFVDKELFMDAEITGLRSRPSLTNDWFSYIRIRSELQRMLDRVEWHAQRLALRTESVVRELQSKLLELWNMYSQLTYDNGNRSTSS